MMRLIVEDIRSTPTDTVKANRRFYRGMMIEPRRVGWSICQISAHLHLVAFLVHRLGQRLVEQKMWQVGGMLAKLGPIQHAWNDAITDK
ncbi:hypothetical protein TNCV_3968521 [Trichonephila clavipes]|nr:hypothetical protein TNCV_3968521 [Trichonephila clavipes]